MTDDPKTLSDGQLRDKLTAAEDALREAAAECERTVAAIRQEAAAARAQGRPAAFVAELEARRDAITAAQTRHVTKCAHTRDALQAETAHRAQRAEADAEAALRADLRKRFLAAGGTDAEFARRYPALREAELTRKTLAPTPPDQNTARDVRVYRPRL